MPLSGLMKAAWMSAGGAMPVACGLRVPPPEVLLVAMCAVSVLMGLPRYPRRAPRRKPRAGRARDSAGGQRVVGLLDLDLQHLEVVLPLEVHLDVLGLDRHVLGDDRDQLALQLRQVVRALAAQGAALVRQEDLQPL